MDFLKTLLQDIPRDRPSVVFDIGANEGGYTWLLREHLPLARIEAFEPLPVMYDKLSARFRHDNQVVYWRAGVSDRCFVAEGMAVHEAWTIDDPARAVRGRNATYGQETFAVRFTTVDDEVRSGYRDRRIDFLKIDTDGYELRVLKGARETILRDRPPILIELGYMVEDLGDSLGDFIREIQSLDYRLYEQGGHELLLDRWREWYPFKTTFDVAMLPSEQTLRPLE